MKTLTIALLLSLSSSLFAATTSYQCHPVEFSNGDSRDFDLIIKKSHFTKNEITWTRTEDNFSQIFQYPKTSGRPYDNNQYLENRDFLKTANNDSIILIYSKDELFIEKSLLNGSDEGVVFNYHEDGNLMGATTTSRTTYLCDKK